MMKKKQPEILNRKVNHLKGQTSPYLLQHLHNPVDWYPWGETAFIKAREENKPILVSIGYSACHWCHVMEKESFENPEVAEIMNRYFICIKVDREERPDVDHLYMTAVQLLTRQGGWPLNCFALPDTRPFWGGTYFPENQWKSILTQVADLYKTRKKDLVEQAQQLTEGIALSAFIEIGGEKAEFNLADAEHVFHNIMNMMDKSEGGTLRAPKFPLPVNHMFLLHYYHHSGDKSALAQVELSLEKMAMGGIYDQIGGGFARYSTDEIWKVPHFEKMLYDNAQLISLYSHAWKISKIPLYRSVVYDTIEFVSRELTSPESTFYSALDADSEGEEGKFYVWKENEINEVLGEDAQWVKDYYQIGKKGYWEHENNILLREETNDAFAEKMNWTNEELISRIHEASQKLLNARSARIRPGLDDKVLTSWNALMINGLADAYAAFGDHTLLEKAKHAANFFIENAITDDGKLYRSLNGNKPSIDAFLEDYAILIQALINLYQVSMDTSYLMKAKILIEYVLINFSSPGTNFFSFSSNTGEKLPAAFYELPDNVIPSSNSKMALNLLYLSEFFEIRDWRDLSRAMLSDINPQLQNQSISYSNWGRLLLQHLYPFKSVVICGPKAQQYLKELQAIFLPGILIAASSSENDGIPLFKNRFQEGETLFYVCSNGACNLPVSQLNKAISQLI